MTKAASDSSTKKTRAKKPQKPTDPNKKITPAKVDQTNILTGTRRRTQVDYSETKAARAGKPVSRTKPVESANTLEKRASAKIEKKKKAAAGSKKTAPTKKATTASKKKKVAW